MHISTYQRSKGVGGTVTRSCRDELARRQQRVVEIGGCCSDVAVLQLLGLLACGGLPHVPLPITHTPIDK